MSVTHIAGLDVEVQGRYLRQRCAWCGDILTDYDYTMIQCVGVWEKPATFPIGKLVRMDGWNPRVSSVLDDGKLPDDACTVSDEPGNLRKEPVHE